MFKEWQERFFWSIQYLIYIWVRSRSLNENESLELDSSKPVCYVLKENYWTDFWVLAHHCKQASLPAPKLSLKNFLKFKRNESFANCLSIFSNPRRSFYLHRKDESFAKKVKEILDFNQDFQFVPVSIFWGRNPGRKDKSLLSFLFLDDQRRSFFQRLLRFFLRGRSVLCYFGKPVSLNSLNISKKDQNSLRKLRRLLLVHFRSQRDAIIGPPLYDHHRVVRNLLTQKRLQDSIREYALKHKITEEKARNKALQYIEEVSARQSHYTVRFFEVSVSWFLKKVYKRIDFHNFSSVQSLAETHEPIYVPCHRSHMDYLIFGLELYRRGLIPLHSVAGINLNFWPVGPLLRRGGAIFIRRSFHGNRLYSAVVKEVMSYFMRSGFPLCFYPEGGRSRTGLLMQAKTGIFSMILEEARQVQMKPLVFIPVYIGYDKIIEGASYRTELRGKRKKTESLKQLFTFRKTMRSNWGKAYVHFAKPIFLKQSKTSFVASFSPSKKGASYFDLSKNSVSDLAHKVMTHINDAAILSPVGLFSLVLLASPRRALPQEDLFKVTECLLEILKKSSYASSSHFPFEKNLETLLKETLSLAKIQHFKHPGGDIFYIDEQDSSLLKYYANNALHFFVLPSLLASFFVCLDDYKKDSLIENCRYIYFLLKEDYFLSWDEKQFEGALLNCIQSFLDLSLLEEDEENVLRRPAILTREFSWLSRIGQIIHPTLEHYALYLAVLAKQDKSSQVTFESWQQDCQVISQRLAILRGFHHLSGDRNDIVGSVWRSLRKRSFISDQDSGSLVLTEQVSKIARAFKDLLSIDLQRSLHRKTFASSNKNEGNEK